MKFVRIIKSKLLQLSLSTMIAMSISGPATADGSAAAKEVLKVSSNALGPVGGGIVQTYLEFIWPGGSDPDPWDAVKDRVAKHVDNALYQDKVRRYLDEIRALSETANQLKYSNHVSIEKLESLSLQFSVFFQNLYGNLGPSSTLTVEELLILQRFSASHLMLLEQLRAKAYDVKPQSYRHFHNDFYHMMSAYDNHLTMQKQHLYDKYLRGIKYSDRSQKGQFVNPCNSKFRHNPGVNRISFKATFTDENTGESTSYSRRYHFTCKNSKGPDYIPYMINYYRQFVARHKYLAKQQFDGFKIDRTNLYKQDLANATSISQTWGQAQIKADPGHFYDSKSWGQLTNEQRHHFSVLGWTQHSWDSPDPNLHPQSTMKTYNMLSGAERNHALRLGYNSVLWNFDINSSDWKRYAWAELNELDRIQWKLLGWNENSWNGHTVAPESATKSWNEIITLFALSKYNGVKAAVDLGFFAHKWNYDLESNYWDQYDWDYMDRADRELWRKLGWNKFSWHGQSNPPASRNQSWAEVTQSNSDIYDDHGQIVGNVTGKQKLEALFELGFDQAKWDQAHRQPVQ